MPTYLLASVGERFGKEAGGPIETAQIFSWGVGEGIFPT